MKPHNSHHMRSSSFGVQRGAKSNNSRAVFWRFKVGLSLPHTEQLPITSHSHTPQSGVFGVQKYLDVPFGSGVGLSPELECIRCDGFMGARSAGGLTFCFMWRALCISITSTAQYAWFIRMDIGKDRGSSDIGNLGRNCEERKSRVRVCVALGDRYSLPNKPNLNTSNNKYPNPFCNPTNSNMGILSQTLPSMKSSSVKTREEQNVNQSPTRDKTEI